MVRELQTTWTRHAMPERDTIGLLACSNGFSRYAVKYVKDLLWTVTVMHVHVHHTILSVMSFRVYARTLINHGRMHLSFSGNAMLPTCPWDWFMLTHSESKWLQ